MVVVVCGDKKIRLVAKYREVKLHEHTTGEHYPSLLLTTIVDVASTASASFPERSGNDEESFRLLAVDDDDDCLNTVTPIHLRRTISFRFLVQHQFDASAMRESQSIDNWIRWNTSLQCTGHPVRRDSAEE